MKARLTAIVQSVALSAVLAAAGFAWSSHAAQVEMRAELQGLRESHDRLARELRSLENWLRDYTIEHERRCR